MSSKDARRVLVTGVGGQPGFDLARTLMQRGHDVIGTDADPFATGLRLPGIIARQSRPATSRDYAASLLKLCAELRPEAMMSTVESELPQLLSLELELAKLGVRTWLPPRSSVRACLDKAEFDKVMTAAGIPTPATWLPHQLADIPRRLALVVKPRRGQGSQNVVFCETPAQARVLCEVTPDPIIQARMTGREFTADCLVDRNGQTSAILRYRLLTKGGLSMVSATFHDPEVTDRVTAVLAAVRASGLSCVQGFICDDSGPGRVLITEMNARAGGAFLLAEAAGADLIGQTLAGLFGHPVDHARLQYKPGVRLTKYVETLTVEGASDANL